MKSWEAVRVLSPPIVVHPHDPLKVCPLGTDAQKMGSTTARIQVSSLVRRRTSRCGWDSSVTMTGCGRW